MTGGQGHGRRVWPWSQDWRGHKILNTLKCSMLMSRSAQNFNYIFICQREVSVAFFKHRWNEYSSWAQIIFFFSILINAQTVRPWSHYSCFIHFTSHRLTKQIKHSISDKAPPPPLSCSTRHFKLAVWSQMDLFPFAYKGLIFHSETAVHRLNTKRQAWQCGDSHSFFFFLSPARSAVVFLDSVRLAISLKCSGSRQRQPPCCKYHTITSLPLSVTHTYTPITITCKLSDNIHDAEIVQSFL